MTLVRRLFVVSCLAGALITAPPEAQADNPASAPLWTTGSLPRADWMVYDQPASASPYTGAYTDVGIAPVFSVVGSIETSPALIGEGTYTVTWNFDTGGVRAVCNSSLVALPDPPTFTNIFTFFDGGQVNPGEMPTGAVDMGIVGGYSDVGATSPVVHSITIPALTPGTYVVMHRCTVSGSSSLGFNTFVVPDTTTTTTTTAVTTTTGATTTTTHSGALPSTGATPDRTRWTSTLGFVALGLGALAIGIARRPRSTRP